MKIKLAILESDKNYLDRIVSVFSTKYADSLQIYSFTDAEIAVSTLATEKIDVLIAGDIFDIDFSKLPKRCSFAYLVDSADIDTLNERAAICKFQKAEMIYKQILSLYSENVGTVSGIVSGDGKSKIVIFCSPSGGTGSSTMAAACATHFASLNQKTLYLNLEALGSSDEFFSADGQFDMSDIIFALKSKKTNLALKLESCVKRDQSGVYFYSRPKIALDMLELSAKETIQLITEINAIGVYENIVIDTDFVLGGEIFDLYNLAHSVLWVDDGSEISNSKTVRAYTALATMEQGMETQVTNKISIIYNKFSNKNCKPIENTEIRNIGGAPRYDHANSYQVISQISGMEIFDKIF